MKFNERLKSMRKRFKITQKTISDHLEITLRTYQRYEEGTIEPPISTVSAIAEFFDMPADCLLGNGFYSNWEDILEYNDVIFSLLSEKLLSFPKALDMSDFSEKLMARFLPAVFAKITFNKNTNTITLYPLIPLFFEKPIEASFDECRINPPTHPKP